MGLLLRTSNFPQAVGVRPQGAQTLGLQQEEHAHPEPEVELLINLSAGKAQPAAPEGTIRLFIQTSASLLCN